MGRYRKNKRGGFSASENVSSGQNGADASVDGEAKSPYWASRKRKFSTPEQERLLAYLREYKALAEYPVVPNGMPAESVVTVKTSNVKEREEVEEEYEKGGVAVSARDDADALGEEDAVDGQGGIDPKDGVTIGVHVFPKLTPELVAKKPYLMLPDTMGSKERRSIHDLCVEAELFHESVGLRGGQRTAVISPYYLGLSELLVEGELSRPHNIPIHECKPWLYRNHGVTLDQYCREMELVGFVGDERPRWPDDATPKRKGRARDALANDVWDRVTNWHFSYERALVAIEADHAAETPTAAAAASSSASAAAALPPYEGMADNSVAHVNRTLKEGKDRVWEMIDQPSRCIRDKIDTFDFTSLEFEDLSTLVPFDIDEFPSLLVDSKETMLQCIRELEAAQPDVLAFDMEMYNASEYTCLTCLVQLSTKDKNYVLDVLQPEVWSRVSLLAPIFADPSVVKIGQSVGSMDVPSLQRDFGIFVVNAFDTYEAACKLKFQSKGLAGICQEYGLPPERSEEYHGLKRLYQACDWRTRPLSKDMLRYGRFDVHYLIALRSLMIRDLTRGSLWDNDDGDRVDKDAQAALVSCTLKDILKRGDDMEEGQGEPKNTDADTDADADADTDAGGSGYFTADDVSGTGTGATNSVNGASSAKLASPRDLRMCASLMRVVTQSQQRCLRMWKTRAEPIKIRQDHIFASLAYGDAADDPWQQGWNRLHVGLCDELILWRQDVAAQTGTMPGLVCSGDLLIAIVRKRPKQHLDLLRLQFFLPELLQDPESEHVQKLFRVIAEFEKDGGVGGAPDTLTDRARSLFEGTTFQRYAKAVGVLAAAAFAASMASMFFGRAKRRP